MDEMLALNQYETSPLFSEKDRAALAFAVEMTANPRNMRRAVKDRLKASMSDAEIVDLTLGCCWYNFMNRFNGGLDVDIDTFIPPEMLELMEKTPGPAEILKEIAQSATVQAG